MNRKSLVARAGCSWNKGTKDGRQDNLLHGAAAWFSSLLAKRSLATMRADVPRSSESYLDQQSVALSRLSTLGQVLTDSWYLKFKCPLCHSHSFICSC